MDGSLSKKKENDLLQEFQEWMKVLDETNTNLAKQIDIMQASAKSVVCQLDVMFTDMKGQVTDNDEKLKEKYAKTYHAAIELLSVVESSVADHKLYTLESVSNCLHRIWPLLKKYHAISTNVEFLPLSIDAYLRDKGPTRVQRLETVAENELAFDTDHFNDQDSPSKKASIKKQDVSNDNIENKNVSMAKIDQKSTPKHADEQIQTTLDMQEIEELQLNNLKLIEDNVNIQTKYTDLQERLVQLETKDQEERKRIEEKDDQIYDIYSQIKQLQKKVEILQEENAAIDHELQILKSKKVFKVQLYCQPRGGLISNIEEDLMQRLKTKFEDNNKKLQFIQCVKTSEIESNCVLLVLCISASRLGTDVANILQGLQLTPKVSILVFHHKDVHALPSEASDRVLSGPQYENVGCILDMAFLSNKGLYPCLINDNSFMRIFNFFDRECDLAE